MTEMVNITTGHIWAEVETGIKTIPMGWKKWKLGGLRRHNEEHVSKHRGRS